MKTKAVWKPVKGQVYEAAIVGSVSVRIYRRARRKRDGELRDVYSVANHLSGRRTLKSFADLSKARAEADRVARQISTGEATAAAMSNSDAASFGRAMELLRPTGLALEVAAAIIVKAIEILGGDHIIESAKFYQRHRADQLVDKRVADVIAARAD
jgi:hypothetical protein